jgi:hypothetical protein
VPSEMKPCIFCGNPADSKEDLFPRWILKRVNTREPLSRRMGDAPPVITEDQEVRLPCVCQKCNSGWMSGMEKTVQKFVGAMIEDFALTLDRQQQRTLAEWAVKCAMCNDTVDVHSRFFTEDECHEFRKTRKIPDRTMVFAAHFVGHSLDSDGVDFTLIEPTTGDLLVRGHIYNVMVGHVVLQVLSWHPEPQHEEKNVQIRSADGPWDQLTVQIWPFEKKSVQWSPPRSLTTRRNVTHYGYFRRRFNREDGHLLRTPKPKA